MHAGIHYYTVAQRQADLSARKYQPRPERPVKQQEDRPRRGLLALLRIRRPAPALG